MNNTKIEWCDSTWNPITGCYHGCEYCYARRIANRFKGCKESPDGTTTKRIVDLDYTPLRTAKSGRLKIAPYPYGFIPTLHRIRLFGIDKVKGKNVFVCSTSDMFGDWVPDSWIKAVFEACEKHPEHRYLFLTKNPGRYMDLKVKGILPEGENFWYGSTATTPEAPVLTAEKHNTFVSVEPIMGDFSEDEGYSTDFINWIIIGAETGIRKGKVVPKKEWIDGLVEYAKKKNIPVFMKDSLIPIWGENLLREFPW